jgi:hypothetical protein
MNKLLGIAGMAAVLVAAAPVSAQVALGAGPGGIGVQVGPGAGFGPDYGWRHRHYRDRFAHRGDCQVVRERTVTPNGRTIFTTRRICD